MAEPHPLRKVGGRLLSVRKRRHRLEGPLAKPEKNAPQPTATILRLLDPLPTSERIEIRIDVDAVSHRKGVPVEAENFLHVVCLGEGSGINVSWMRQPVGF